MVSKPYRLERKIESHRRSSHIRTSISVLHLHYGLRIVVQRNEGKIAF